MMLLLYFVLVKWHYFLRDKFGFCLSLLFFFRLEFHSSLCKIRNFLLSLLRSEVLSSLHEIRNPFLLLPRSKYFSSPQQVWNGFSSPAKFWALFFSCSNLKCHSSLHWIRNLFFSSQVRNLSLLPWQVWNFTSSLIKQSFSILSLSFRNPSFTQHLPNFFLRLRKSEFHSSLFRIRTSFSSTQVPNSFFSC